MTNETVRVRVVDQIYNADGHPVLDGKGRPKRCQGTYLFAGKAYLPGDIIDMPANIAALELKLHGGSGQLPPILELAEAHEERLQRQAELRGREDHERTAFARKTAELEAQVAQAQKLKDLVRERDEELRLRGGEIERARAEVPQDVAERLARLEETAARQQQTANDRAEHHRKVAEAEREARQKAEAAAQAAQDLAVREKTDADARAAKAEAAAKAHAAELEALRKELDAAKAAARTPSQPHAQPGGNNPRRPG